MDRKSLLEWWEDDDGAWDRQLRYVPALPAIVAAELEEMGFEPADEQPTRTVEVNELEYAVWLSVELARADSADEEEFAARLEQEFGSRTVADEARRLYDSIIEKRKRAGPRAVIHPPESLDIRRLKVTRYLEQYRAPKPTMTREEIILHTLRRAQELGFSPADIWARRQGRRSPRFDEEKAARAQIVVELRDLGATRTDIGAIFANRAKQSIADLEALGREQEAERTAREKLEQGG